MVTGGMTLSRPWFVTTADPPWKDWFLVYGYCSVCRSQLWSGREHIILLCMHTVSFLRQLQQIFWKGEETSQGHDSIDLEWLLLEVGSKRGELFCVCSSVSVCILFVCVRVFVNVCETDIEISVGFLSYFYQKAASFWLGFYTINFTTLHLILVWIFEFGFLNFDSTFYLHTEKRHASYVGVC